jgi:acyl carrier protein
VRGAWFAAALLLAGMAVAPRSEAVPPVPYHEIVESTRALAAGYVGRKAEEIDTTRSLAAQGMNEKMLRALVIDLQQEFGVVIPEEQLRRARWDDPIAGLTVRRLAQMVDRQMKEPH